MAAWASHPGAARHTPTRYIGMPLRLWRGQPHAEAPRLRLSTIRFPSEGDRCSTWNRDKALGTWKRRRACGHHWRNHNGVVMRTEPGQEHPEPEAAAALRGFVPCW